MDILMDIMQVKPPAQDHHDALTSLLNRRGFGIQLSQLLEQPPAHGDDGHALLCIDLDQFKIVNNAVGHAAGDRLLIQVVNLLSTLISEHDILARLGGDEFALLLPRQGVQTAEAMAERIVQTFEAFRFPLNNQRFRIGLSIGVVPLDGHLFSLDAVLQAANTSCFVAKQAGSNRWHTWAETDSAMVSRKLTMGWITRLQDALDQDRLELYAQRIVPLAPAADQALRAEVLLRLRDVDGSLVMPDNFLPPAEEFLMATRIDQWVCEKTLSLLANQPSLDGIAYFALNISGQSVVDPCFRQTLDQLLEQAGPEISRRLCFEITETAAIANVPAAVHFITTVRKRGSSVALDDFGSGFASFGALKSLPVTHLKIDGQFVAGVIDDPFDAVAVRCFVEVAEVMGLCTVAEYVESPLVLERLRQLGVHDAQGHYLHSPEPFETLLAGDSANRAS